MIVFSLCQPYDRLAPYSVALWQLGYALTPHDLDLDKWQMDERIEVLKNAEKPNDHMTPYEQAFSDSGE